MTPTLERAVETAEIVRALRRYGLTQADIATATGASPRSVRHWSQGRPPRRTHEQRLQELRRIILILSDSLTETGVGQWLRARNRLLEGRRPLEVLAAGEPEEVVAAAHAFVDGVYV